MKKFLIFVGALFLAGFLMSSCQKCVTCTYEHLGETHTSGQQCGTTEQIQDIEDTWMQYEEELEVTVTCERN
jgi:hypothetical protein